MPATRISAPVGVEIGRDRDIGFLGAAEPRVLLDQARDFAGVARALSASIWSSAVTGKRIGASDQAALGVVDGAADVGEHAAQVGKLDAGRGAGDLVVEAGRQAVVFQHADALAAGVRDAACRPPAPGFGVLTISLSVSVVRIQLATRFDSAVANTGAPVARQQQHAVGPVRREAGEPGHRARLHQVGVEQRRVEAVALHRVAQPRDARLQRRLRQFFRIPSHQAAAHGRYLYAGMLNSSRAVPVKTSQPSLVTATTSPSTR